jgi:sulfhydrogenase subunit alpha
MKININYLARVEGEAAVRFEIKDRRLVRFHVNIWEPPRFFEGFLVGRQYDEVPDIVARICGICPISHMTTAIRALEKALGITPPPATVALQKVMALSQLVASHLVHLYMLALPDYHDLPSSAAMMPGFQAELARFVRMKKVVNNVNAELGGRALHPVAMTVAGFTRPPDRKTINELVRQLAGIRQDSLETLKMIAALEIPPLHNKAEYVALAADGEYAINRGRLFSDRGLDAAEDAYPDHFVEEQVVYANAKRTAVRGRGALMVGALARFNLKSNVLHPDAAEAAAQIGFAPPVHNPFHNNLAQAIEVIHGISECMEILRNLPADAPWTDIRPRQEGKGNALTEAPRGLLRHYYALNRRGEVVGADIVTPTAHNFLGLEENLRRLIESDIDAPPDEISRRCAMLVRAYDPCFSCSVH